MGNIGILDFNTSPNWMISQRFFIQNHPVNLSAGQDLDDLDLDLSQRSWVQQESEFDHQRWGFKPCLFFFGNRNEWIWVWGCLNMAKWSAHLWPYYAILIYSNKMRFQSHEVASLFSDNPTYHLHGDLCPDVVEDHFSIWGSPLPNKIWDLAKRASHPTLWTEMISDWKYPRVF